MNSAFGRECHLIDHVEAGAQVPEGVEEKRFNLLVWVGAAYNGRGEACEALDHAWMERERGKEREKETERETEGPNRKRTERHGGGRRTMKKKIGRELQARRSACLAVVHSNFA